MNWLRLRLLGLLLAPLTVASAALTPGEEASSLPLDQNLPTRLEGYRLVQLDKFKEIIFAVGERRIPVQVPIFAYLPERDRGAELRKGLQAIQGDLARLAAQQEPVDPARLMTLSLAFEKLLSSTETPVSVNPESAVEAVRQKAPRTGLENAISKE